MNAKEFFHLVRKMRMKQQDYFRTKSAAILRECKDYERAVDAEISRVEAIEREKREPKLFL